MTELLGWDDTNEAGIDEWLVSHEYYMGNARITRDPAELIEEYRTGSLKPKKGEMWRVPADILGPYCILDAEATYLLHTRVFLPRLRKHPQLLKWLTVSFQFHIRQHRKQHVWGLDVDVAGLRQLLADTTSRRVELLQEIRRHPEAAAHVGEIEMQLLVAKIGEEPARYKKSRPLSDEPARLKRNGEESKTWHSWELRRIAALTPTQSKTWESWDARRASLLANPPQFNPHSDPQLIELMYERLGYPVEVTTETGGPSTSQVALEKMGPLGQLISSEQTECKRESSLRGYLELVETRNTIHPSFRMPGTCTGRLSGKEPNFQQVEKSAAVMRLFRAAPGNEFVDVDFASIESVIAGEFSGDPGLTTIFAAPSGLVNDSYLYLGYHIPGRIGDEIAASGYSPSGNTPSQLATAKKLAKWARTTCKPVMNGCLYGARGAKIRQSLSERGVFLAHDEENVIYRAFWEAFAGLREYSDALGMEWWATGGWIANGFGRPMCLAPDMRRHYEEYPKDLLNRLIQSTAHDVLVEFGVILDRLLRAAGIEYKPVLWDLHDSCTIEVSADDVPRTLEVFRQALLQLNAELGCTIPITGVPTHGVTLADVKEPDE